MHTDDKPLLPDDAAANSIAATVSTSTTTAATALSRTTSLFVIILHLHADKGENSGISRSTRV